MTTIELATPINAPIERCFDLARSIDLHMESTRQTGEKVIAGRTSGLIALGETVTWRAKHLGVWQTLTAINSQTVMKDIFAFESPYGMLGEFANFLFLGWYMENLLKKRNNVIKKAAESDHRFG